MDRHWWRLTAVKTGKMRRRTSQQQQPRNVHFLLFTPFFAVNCKLTHFSPPFLPRCQTRSLLLWKLAWLKFIKLLCLNKITMRHISCFTYSKYILGLNPSRNLSIELSFYLNKNESYSNCRNWLKVAQFIPIPYSVVCTYICINISACTQTPERERGYIKTAQNKNVHIAAWARIKCRDW